MKNSTTALALAVVCMIANLVANMPSMFISSSIFAAATLILQELEENGSK